MKNNNGFISTSIIFAFFITFLMLLVIIITTYAQNRILMNQVKKDMKNNLVIKYNFNTDEISNIVKAYTYNEDSTAENFCLNGNEETCVETTCYESTEANSCASGTIVDYRVNNTDKVRFHVIHDDGSTLTMQSQKNTVYNVAWYGTEQDYTNVNGPMTILPVLESKTSGWSNVNTINYTMGTTTFKTSAYTGCSSYNECVTNTYTLSERTAKARMITVQETSSLGCSSDTNSCPYWIRNYLRYSDDKIENGAICNCGYWTMNARSTSDVGAYGVRYGGYMAYISTYDNNYGARAVVEINKE